MVRKRAVGNGRRLAFDWYSDKPKPELRLGIDPVPLESVRYREVRAYMVRNVGQAAPAPPTGGTYNFTTNVYTAPSGWTEDFPSYSAGQVVYCVVATAN